MDANRSGTVPEGARLNLGCGPVQPVDWVNIDGSNRAFLATKLRWLDSLLVRCGLLSTTEFGRSTQYLNLFNGLPYPDESIACIYAGELWEHFEYPDALKLTKECFRVLKPNGVLRVCVPDGPTFWEKYLALYREEVHKPAHARSAQRLVEHTQLFFNDICTKPTYLRSAGHTHKWQFDEIQLTDVFAASGFVDVERRRFLDSRIPGVESVERSNFLIVEGVRPG